MAKNINKLSFSEETLLKLDIFRECFREWFPVFLHTKYISNIFIYDLFAGSGTDADGTFGSPLILLEEARGNKQQHCSHFAKSPQRITFAFNEYQKRKAIALEQKVQTYLEKCKEQCNIEAECPYLNSCHFKHDDFQTLFQSPNFRNVLSNKNYGKFILLDQYGFKQINKDVFLTLANSPKTDFIFFISSSSIKRFYELEVVQDYLSHKKINFDEGQPKECHRIMAKYFRSLLPTNQEFYLHHFTIQNHSNYYGLIFCTSHTFGMEKFLKVCWHHDPLAGESNCNIYADFEPGTLFHSPSESNKKEKITKALKHKILTGQIRDNISGLKYILREGGKTSFYLETIEFLIAAQKIEIIGQINKSITSIHNIDKYQFKLKQHENNKNRMDR